MATWATVALVGLSDAVHDLKQSLNLGEAGLGEHGAVERGAHIPVAKGWVPP